MCHVTRDSIDRVWQKLAIAMFSGGLGPTVYMVKVLSFMIKGFYTSIIGLIFRSALRLKTARTST